MYKIMIVEDEPIIREGLVKTIHWENMGFEIVATASNGKEAFEKVPIFNPDVIISDIRMPIMNGIELLEAVKRDYEKVVFLILSGFEEFDYAKKAINMGAIGYILKHTIKSDIEPMMEKIKKILIQEASVEQMKEQDTRYKKIAFREAFRSILYGDETGREEIIVNHENMIQKTFKSFVIRISNYYSLRKENTIKNFYSTLNEFEQGLSKMCCESEEEIVLLHNKENEYLLVFISNKKSHDLFNESEDIRRILNWVADTMIANEFSYVIGVGNQHLGLDGFVKSYKEAIQSTFYWKFNRNTKVIQWNEVSNKQIEKNKPDNLKEIEEKIIHNIEISRKDDALASLDTWILEWRKLVDVSLLTIRQSCIELLSILLWRVQEVIVDAEELFDIKQDVQEIMSINNVDFLFEWLKIHIQRTINTYEHYRVDYNESVIRSITQYIDTHIDERIMLKEMADYVYLNASYLSVLFKKSTNCTFTEFVIEKKMNYALELLKDGTKVKDAAEKTGYNDIKHFRKVFKDYFGFNPGEI